MAPRCRSLTFLLVLELAVQSQVNAFNIRKNSDPVSIYSDAVGAASTALEVKSELPSYNIVTTDKDGTTNSSISPSYKAIMDDTQKYITVTVIDFNPNLVTDDKVNSFTSQISADATEIPVTLNDIQIPSYKEDTTIADVEKLTNIVNVAKNEATDTSSISSDVSSTNDNEVNLMTEPKQSTSIDPTSTDVLYQNRVTTIDNERSPVPDITTTDSNSDIRGITNPDNGTVSNNIEIAPYHNEKAVMQSGENFSQKSEDKSTKTISGDFSTVLPYWKKYTVIDRKRITSTEDTTSGTENEEIMVGAGAAQSGLSLETAFSILSSEPPTAPVDETIPDVDSSTPIQRITPPRMEVVSSMRAGYLDMTSRSTAPPPETTTIERDIPEVTINQIESTEKPSVENQPITEEKTNGDVSQSQLAEDAIVEQIMKEDFLEGSGQRRINTNPNDEPKNDQPNDLSTDKDPVIKNSSTEDILSVKPISTERPKNTSLYAVNPNYKPLKKIEVQPPKPFVRNPDDNSWRNESLSSRGIVFKANNSSKPFTQVLKNKTETEWNSLSERYNKGDEPELKARLEKITETRKSKKKKTDNNGDSVYVDYEEVNALEETNSTSTQNVVSAGTPVNKTTLTTPLLTSILPSLVQGVPADVPERPEVGFTTSKSNYKVNSFDTDVDDDEYVTLQDIDLKKYFTTKTKPLVPIQTTTTAAPKPQFPARKPTVQYFPPLQKHKEAESYYEQEKPKVPRIFDYAYADVPKVKPSPVYHSRYEERPSDDGGPKLEYDTHITHKPIESRNKVIANIQNNEYGNLGPNYNPPSYIIKHWRELAEEPLQTTRPPLRENNVKPAQDYYDYETNFRKDVLDKFVENFNQNSERFKVDFPILYNTSVVHTNPDGGRGQAASSAFVKRLYDDQDERRLYDEPLATQPPVYRKPFAACDPNCEKTVELSPSYELHYYFPEEEEKDQAEPKSALNFHSQRI